MKNNDELRDELNDSPFLKKMKEQPGEGFKVPKHYFEHLPDEVWKQVKRAPTAAPNRLGLLERLELFLQGLLQPQYALALASVLVLVVASVFFFKDKNTNDMQQPMAEVRLEDISDEELFSYVSNNISDFDRKLMLEVTQTVLPDAEPQAKPNPKRDTQQPNLEEMEKYLDGMIDDLDLEDLENML